ncbi:MAG: heme biosynthesis protein HemY [Betaproteobacteria bacterium]|nr:heme biosynthesis protein HemY [Betaproteobacteria bacterium]
MRALILGTGLFALAVVLTLAAHYNSGYVLIALQAHRIELSLNLAVLLLLLACVAFYALVRGAQLMRALPEKARAFRADTRFEQSRRALEEALNAYFESHYGKAERAAASAASPEHRALAGVIAARSSHELRNFQGRDDYLAAMEHHAPARAYLRLITQAELLLDERRYHDALSALSRLPEKHSAALNLELRAQQLAHNWDQVLALLPQLERRKVFEPAVLARLRGHCHRENLRAMGPGARALREYWSRIAAEDRLESATANAGAKAFLAVGEKEEASAFLEKSLQQQWEPALLDTYAQCTGDDPRRQLEYAESWLRDHPKDGALLLALGKICARAALWGKARSYLEASLAIEESFAARLELARLLDYLGESSRVREHLERALKLAISQNRESRQNEWAGNA